METPSPQCIGQEFVRQYYTILHEVPEELHRFYSHDSCFVHGGVDRPGEATPHVQGQQDIHSKIMSLSFRNCYVKIGQVDSQPTVGGAVVVQVTGELSNNGQPMRRFMQTFVLVSQSPKKYYVHNDIFRYQDEVFADAESDGELVDDCPDGEHLMLASDGESEPVEPTLTVAEPLPTAVSQPSVTPPQPAPASMYYESTPQPPLSNGTLHMEEPEPVVAVTPKMEEPEPVIPEPVPEEPKDIVTFDAPAPPAPEKPVKIERSPSPEPEQRKGSGQSGGNMTWAAMLQRSDGGPGPVPQAPPPASKAQLGPPKAPLMSEPKPMDMAGGPPQSQRMPRPPRERSDRRERDGSRQGDGPPRPGPGGEDPMRRPPQFPDSQQVFVGNLPHTMSEKDLKEYFGQWGNVVDIRINKKMDRTSEVPNYGFIVFDDEKHVQSVLKNRGNFTLNDGHRLNVEEKKQRGETGGRGGPRGGGRGGSFTGRGGSMGGNMGWGAPRSRGPGGPGEGRGGPGEGRGGGPDSRGGGPRGGRGFGGPRR